MDVTKILADALKAVTDAAIPPELQKVAFKKAVDLLSEGTASAAETAALEDFHRQLQEGLFATLAQIKVGGGKK